MTKKPRSPQVQDANSPATRAARIAGKFGLTGAIVSATAVVLATVIGVLLKQSPVPENGKLVVKVIDAVTRHNIKNAKVSAESNSIPVVDSTDDQGVITFLIEDQKKEIRIRVEADGYVSFNLRVTPANIVGVQEISLTPIKAELPTPTPASLPPTPTPSPTHLPSPRPMSSEPKLGESHRPPKPAPSQPPHRNPTSVQEAVQNMYNKRGETVVLVRDLGTVDCGVGFCKSVLVTRRYPDGSSKETREKFRWNGKQWQFDGMLH